MTVFRCEKCGLENHAEDPDEDTKLCDRVKCNGTMWRMDSVEGLEAITDLSSRLAEAYLLVSSEHKDMRVKDAAEEMGIEPDTLSGWLNRIRERIRKAEATAKLSL